MTPDTTAQAHIDTRALEQAVAVKEGLRRHEDFCAKADRERRGEYRELKRSISSQHRELSTDIVGIHQRLDRALWRVVVVVCATGFAITTGLIGVIGYLITRGAPWTG